MDKEIIQKWAKDFLENVIGIFYVDPNAAIDMALQLKNFPSTIRDGIFCETLWHYLTNVYDIDDNGKRINKNKLKISEMLARQSPNEEAGYEGNPENLRENVKRLIKMIDGASTIQKAYYYANLTRAALNEYITRNKFFKLCKCIDHLTEEDLIFLTEDIQKTGNTTIKEDRDNIDDFRAVGLMVEVEGGFAYTLRAFELLKYGLKYEEIIHIPDEIQSRMIVGTVGKSRIENMFKVEDGTLSFVFDDDKSS